MAVWVFRIFLFMLGTMADHGATGWWGVYMTLWCGLVAVVSVEVIAAHHAKGRRP